MNIAAIAVFAASSLVPSQPNSFETVNLRMTVDSCTYVPSTVRVSQSSNVIRVIQQPNNCFAAGSPLVVDVRLGALPAGDYRVEVYATSAASGPPAESLSFQVRDPVEVAVFPPPVRPLTDYSGIWFNPGESGWGLTLHQGPMHSMFGLLFVYNAQGQPEWFSLQNGRWISPTKWQSTLHRTTGPYYGALMFNAGEVAYHAVGIADLDFSSAPIEQGRASLSWSVEGRAVVKTVQRMPL